MSEKNKKIGIKAFERWKKVSPQQKQKVLANVWCGKCMGGVRIIDYNYEIVGKGVVLKGKCENCGSPVARFLEGG